MVPIVDLKRRHRRFEAAFATATARVLGSGTVLLGDELAAFERELAGALHRTTGDPCAVVGVASGASALQLAMVGLGIGPGDEVVVPALTAVPTGGVIKCC